MTYLRRFGSDVSTYGGGSLSTTELTTELAVSSFYFDPSIFVSPTVNLHLLGTFNSSDGGATLSLRLYDMGAGTGAFTPVLRATATIASANMGQYIVAAQALTLVTSPGVGSNQIHNTIRVYETRLYLNTATVGSSASVTWGGLYVT